jgi:NAD(P)H-hydrate epimerase
VRISQAELPDWVIEGYERSGGKVFSQPDKQRLVDLLKASDFILDGIIGTGFTPPMREDLSGVLKFIKSHCTEKRVIAVDCPSGVDCLTGTAEDATLPATLTVCMEGVKTGMMRFPAFDYAGEITAVDVGILKKIHKIKEIHAYVIDPEMVVNVLPDRKAYSHKGTFGSVLVCGGSVNYPGAPIFTANAAYRVGCGLVKTAVPERIYDVAVSQCPESTWVILDEENGVICDKAEKVVRNEMGKVNCLAIGPGIGLEEPTFRFIKGILTTVESSVRKNGAGFLQGTIDHETGEKISCPVVIDADALRLLARIPEWSKKLSQSVVLTPHPGEMSSLTGLSIDEIQNQRIEICQQYAKEWQQVIVLKGPLTVIVSPEGKMAINPIASSALAKAGSGDILTGIIAGLVAQGAGLFDAAVAGVWIHGMAGVLAAEKLHVEESVGVADIISSIGAAIQLAKKK